MRQTPRSAAEGARAAAEEHARLGTALDAPVDIFGAIERHGIWLMFQPLDRLFGAYMRVGEAAGVIVNAKQPPALQRFTAAHELGHHVLGHASSLDGEAHIEPVDGELGPREQAAHAFAAYYLMPPALVDQVLARLGVEERGALSAEVAYRLSLELGVSYAAAVNHLLSLGKITADVAARLRGMRPKAIKQALTGTPRPAYDRTDTWVLGQTDSGRVIAPRVDDEIYATLPEIPSSGYRWAVASDEITDLRSATAHAPAFGGALALVDDRFDLPAASAPPARYGTGGMRRLVFRVLRPGSFRLQLAQRRPWEATAVPAATWQVELRAMPHRTMRADWGLRPTQKPLLAHAVA